MTDMNAETTVKYKLEFEQVCNAYGVRVLHYHAAKGLFDTNAVNAYVTKAQQTL